MKTVGKLWILVVSLAVMLAACGGGGGGGDTTSAADTSTNTDTNTNTNAGASLAGGCAGYENNAFNGSCQDYYGIPASTYQANCTSPSVFYANGCPATIGSSSRVGSCTMPASSEQTYFIVRYYSPENTSENAQTLCGFMGGTWAN